MPPLAPRRRSLAARAVLGVLAFGASGVACSRGAQVEAFLTLHRQTADQIVRSCGAIAPEQRDRVGQAVLSARSDELRRRFQHVSAVRAFQIDAEQRRRFEEALVEDGRRVCASGGPRTCAAFLALVR